MTFAFGAFVGLVLGFSLAYVFLGKILGKAVAETVRSLGLARR